MKPTLAILALVALSAACLPASSQARKISYRGFADVAGGAPVNFAISTTHGVQFSSKYFLGFGAELNYGSDLDSEYALSLFLRNRLDFTNGKRWHAFVEAAPGFSKTIDTSQAGFMANLGVGARCSLSQKLGLNFGLTFSFYDSRDVYGGDYWIDPSFMIGARVGIDF